MGTTLNPLTLTFSDENLERKYITSIVQKDQHFQEFLFIGLETIMLVGMLFSSRVPTPTNLFLHSVTVLTLHLVLLKWVRMQFYIRYRFWFQLALRMYRAWIATKWFPLWIISENQHFVQTFILRSGLTASFWYGIGMRTTIWHLIIFQSITIAYLIWSTSRAACVAIVESMGSSEIIQIWNFLSEMVTGNLDSLVFFNPPSCNADPCQLCFSLVVLAHVHIGIVFPFVLYWFLEIRSRHKYVENTNTNRNECQPYIDFNTFLKPEIVAYAGKICTCNSFLLWL